MAEDASGKTLYLWAAPVFHPHVPVDHTWVTSFDGRSIVYPTLADVIAASDLFWFCYGRFRPSGTIGNYGGCLAAMGVGDTLFAQCLVEANADSWLSYSARGTIFSYGVDGTCHQLSNQILAATGNPPLTSAGVKGYWFTFARFGDYGANAASFAAKMAACRQKNVPRGAQMGAILPSTPASGGGSMLSVIDKSSTPDEFEKRAQELLAASPEVLNKLLKWYWASRVDTAARASSDDKRMDIDAINRWHDEWFKAAFEILGPERFERIFEMPYKPPVWLVDPSFKKRA